MKPPRAQLFAIALLSAVLAHAEGWPGLSGGPVVGGGENDAALVIGIDRYAYAPAIPGAEKNAEDWYRYLVKGRKVPASNVILLRGREGTRERIQKYAKDASSRVKPGGTLWFIFIGHGAPSMDGREGVLVGHDAQQDVDSLYARSLGQSQLGELLGTGGAARTVMVLDACFSGRTPSGEELIKGIQPLIPVRSETKQSDALVLTAARSDQFAGALPGVERPAFSYLVLGGLRGWADGDRNGWVSGRELIDYAAEALRTVVRDRSQTPELQGDPEAPLVEVGGERSPDLAQLALASSPGQGDDTVVSAAGAPTSDFGTRTASGSSRLIDVELVSANASSSWDIYVDDEVICTTPCSRKLDPLRPLLFRARGDSIGPPDRISLTKLQTDGTSPSSPIMVQAHETSGGLFATGIVFASLGGMAAVTGGFLGALGCARSSPDLCTGGLVTVPVGLLTAAASIYMIIASQPRAEIVPLEVGRVELTGPGSLAVAF